MQVDPTKPKLKPPRSMRLKLKCDIPLLTSAFEINLRCYIKENKDLTLEDLLKEIATHEKHLVYVTTVRRCRLKPADPPRVESALAS